MESFLQITIVDIFLIIGGVFGGLFVKFLHSYYSMKAEGLATREDIEEIAYKIESIKNLYSKDLASLKAQLNSRLFIHQTRYQNEFDILKELSAVVTNLRDAVYTLRPKIDFVGSDGEEEKERRLENYNSASIAFYKVYIVNKPFYPEKLYQQLKSLYKLAYHEVLQYSHYSSQPGNRNYKASYYDDAAEMREKILEETEKIENQIRDRVKYWEEFHIDSLTQKE